MAQTKKNIRQRIGIFIKGVGEALVYSGTSGNDSVEALTSVMFGGFSLGGHRISVDALYTIWRNSGDVLACVRELSENCGSEGYEWENVIDNSEDPNPKSVADAEYALNAFGSMNRWKATMIRDVEVTGNSYNLVVRNPVGKVVGIDRIDPRTISVVTDKFGTILKWVQRVGADVKTFAPEDVLHFYLIADPNSPVFGFSALEAIIWDVRTDLASMVSNYSFFQNDATPAAQYIADDGITDAELDRAVRMLQEQTKGADKRHKSVILKGIKEIKTLSFSNKDMEFAALRAFTTEKVCAALGVPKAILNYTDKVNLANGQEQTEKFWQGTIEPLQEAVADFINRKVLPALGIEDIRISYKTKSFQDNQWLEDSTRADVEHGILTVNEAREMRGFDKYDPAVDGDIVDKPLIWPGASVRPLEDVGTDLTLQPIPDTIGSSSASAADRIRQAAKKWNYGRTDLKRAALSRNG